MGYRVGIVLFQYRRKIGSGPKTRQVFPENKPRAASGFPGQRLPQGRRFLLTVCPVALLFGEIFERRFFSGAPAGRLDRAARLSQY
jgi:hypothetical protein